jgi:hypothetical protein
MAMLCRFFGSGVDADSKQVHHHLFRAILKMQCKLISWDCFMTSFDIDIPVSSYSSLRAASSTFSPGSIFPKGIVKNSTDTTVLVPKQYSTTSHGDIDGGVIFLRARREVRSCRSKAF